MPRELGIFTVQKTIKHGIAKMLNNELRIASKYFYVTPNGTIRFFRIYNKCSGTVRTATHTVIYRKNKNKILIQRSLKCRV